MHVGNDRIASSSPIQVQGRNLIGVSSIRPLSHKNSISNNNSYLNKKFYWNKILFYLNKKILFE